VRLIAIFGTTSSFIATLLLKPGLWVGPAGFAIFAFNIVCLTLVVATMSPVSLPYYSPLAISMTQGIVCFGLAMMSFVEGILLALITVSLFFITATLFWPEPALVILFNGTWLLTVISLVGIGAYCLDRTLRIAWLRQIDLTAAEERVRVLLHNILPPPIAARKLRGEVVIADNFSAASLLFADVVGFTELSAKMTPTDVVVLLNDLFARFDRIVARYGLEKNQDDRRLLHGRVGNSGYRPGASQKADASSSGNVERSRQSARTEQRGTFDPDWSSRRAGNRGSNWRVKIYVRCMGRYRKRG
jgi:hypothetical protein